MIPKSGNRFSEKLMLHQKVQRDGDSMKSHSALAKMKRRRTPRSSAVPGPLDYSV